MQVLLHTWLFTRKEYCTCRMNSDIPCIFKNKILNRKKCTKSRGLGECFNVFLNIKVERKAGEIN